MSEDTQESIFDAIMMIANSKQMAKLNEKFNEQFDDLEFGQMLVAYVNANWIANADLSVAEANSMNADALQMAELFVEALEEDDEECEGDCEGFSCKCPK